ncbi:MAG: hypothetical protein HQ503_18025, partial [Rhodospirillales bacterium]|nr:hypothetical protein [Rhodospirillales bacterium]
LWLYGPNLPKVASDKLQRLAIKHTGRRIPFFSGYRANTSGVINMGHWFNSVALRNAGLPLPGSLVKLMPLGDNYELWIKPPGKGVLQWRAGGAHLDAVDADGFVPAREVVKFIDPEQPYLGLELLGPVSGHIQML